MVALILIGVPLAVLAIGLIITFTARTSGVRTGAGIVLLLLGVAGIGVGVCVLTTQIDPQAAAQLRMHALVDGRAAQVVGWIRESKEQAPIGIAICVGVVALGAVSLARARSGAPPMKA